MSDLPRLYSFEELLASLPGMDARALKGRLKEWGYQPPDGRSTMFFGSDQIEHIKYLAGQASKGCVYFLRCGSAVKVGYSEQFAYRLAELQTGNPIKLEVYKTISGERQLERDLHKLFRRYRIHGEWFKWCTVVRKEIDRL